MLTISEQVRALLNDTAHNLVKRTLGKSVLEPGDYSRVITVTFDEIVEHLVANYSVSNIAAKTESQADGYYALPDGGCWAVYAQERACALHREVVCTKKDVFVHFTTHVLGMHPD